MQSRQLQGLRSNKSGATTLGIVPVKRDSPWSLSNSILLAAKEQKGKDSTKGDSEDDHRSIAAGGTLYPVESCSSPGPAQSRKPANPGLGSCRHLYRVPLNGVIHIDGTQTISRQEGQRDHLPCAFASSEQHRSTPVADTTLPSVPWSSQTPVVYSYLCPPFGREFLVQLVPLALVLIL